MSEGISETIRHVLQTKPVKAEPGQNRGVPRYSVRARVTIQPLLDDGKPDGRPEKVWMRDISSTGVGFVNGKPLRIGMELWLHVPDLDDLSPLRCRIVRCEKMAGEQFVVGAQYTSAPGSLSLANADLSGLAAPQIGTPAAAGATLPSAAVTRLTATVAARGSAASTVHDAAAALAEQVRRAASNSATPTALIGLDKRILWVNEAFPALLGVKAAEMANIPFEGLTRTAATPAGTPIAAGKVRTAYAHKSGAAVPVFQTVNTLRDVSGKPLFLIAVAEPIKAVPANATAQTAAPAAAGAGAAPTAKPAAPAPNAADEVERIRRAMFT